MFGKRRQVKKQKKKTAGDWMNLLAVTFRAGQSDVLLQEKLQFGASH